jgi:CheY-like chemotaxis protein
MLARDQKLFRAVTDCGAGGFSSAVGEMGEETGAEVWLEKAPLKYSGLSYTEIWISEAQERMVLAVPPVERRAAAPAEAEIAETRPALSAEVLSVLEGRKALLVDDDVRNVFALTSALEQYGMAVVQAETGREGIETLKRVRDIDLVLMDMMMPDLDGYDTIRIVRQLEPYRKLPIIAVTAKAMLGDREKCIRAGATDYVAKPVDIEALLVKLAETLQH